MIKFSKPNLHKGLELEITEAYSMQEDIGDRLVSLKTIFDLTMT